MSSLYRQLLRHSLLVSLPPILLLGLWLTHDLETRRLAELRLALRESSHAALRHASPDPARAAAALAQIAAGRSGLRLALYHADGTLVARTDPGPAGHRPGRRGRAATSSEATVAGDELVYSARSPASEGRPELVVQGALPLQAERAAAARLRGTLVLAFLLAGAGAAALAARVSRRLAEPLDAIAGAARRVREGEWSVVTRLTGPEEIRLLTMDVNGMVDRLRRLVHETEEGRAQLEAILAQMDDGLLVLDGETRVIRANAAAIRLLEIDGGDPTGRMLLEAAPIYPLEAVARQALAGGRPEAVELRTPRRGSAVRVLAGTLRPHGRPEGATLLIQDLTEIRRVDQMRRDFVANVSHELRTPIAALRALAETLVLRSGRRPEIVADYSARMVAETERLGRLVDDLLVLSRIESGKWELRPRDVETETLVRSVADRFRDAAASRRVTLTAAADAGVLRVDPEAMETVLGNLVDNAVKYTPPGGRVSVRADREGERVLFTVADTGVGIGPEDLPRVFERFYRVDPARSREVEGIGLGLAIVKHLCELQGARVWVESDLGEGSRFHVEIASGSRRPGAGAESRLTRTA